MEADSGRVLFAASEAGPIDSTDSILLGDVGILSVRHLGVRSKCAFAFDDSPAVVYEAPDCAVMWSTEHVCLENTELLRAVGSKRDGPAALLIDGCLKVRGMDRVDVDHGSGAVESQESLR